LVRLVLFRNNAKQLVTEEYSQKAVSGRQVSKQGRAGGRIPLEKFLHPWKNVLDII